MKFYGIAELAKELEWSTEKTHVYFTRKKFVEPDSMVGSRPLWTKDQLKKIVKEHKIEK